MNDSITHSNESSDYEANSETLDELYREQLQSLRVIILKQNQVKDIDLCHKWLKVFGKTAKAEKVARNCLCALMQEQLQECGSLSEPFTNLQNCNRDLECVLRQVDSQSCITEQNDSNTTYTSHRYKIRQVETENHGEPVNSFQECMENKTQTENVFLRHELESLRLLLTEKQIENLRLKEIASKYEMENAKSNDRYNTLKQIFVVDIEKLLKELQTIDGITPLNIFEKAFREFSDDENFSTIINNYDSTLQVVMCKKFEHEISKMSTFIAHKVSRNVSKTKVKLREKYERRLRVQGWAQRLQLKLVKLKCFSVLRHIFINTQNGSKEAMLGVLKVLEEKYQSIVNEIL